VIGANNIHVRGICQVVTDPNLVGLQAEGVMFQVAVTDAVGHIVKQTSEQPPQYLVKLLFSFRGVSELEVPADRIHGDE
jgi:hypothetical protein